MAYPIITAAGDYTAEFPGAVFTPGIVRDFHPDGIDVVDEEFTVPSVSDGEGRFRLRLNQVPREMAGATLTVDGASRDLIPFGEEPATGQIAISLLTGDIEFNAADAGEDGLASYTGKGSYIGAYHYYQLANELEAVQEELDGGTVSGPESWTANQITRAVGSAGDEIAGSQWLLITESTVDYLQGPELATWRTPQSEAGTRKLICKLQAEGSASHSWEVQNNAGTALFTINQAGTFGGTRGANVNALAGLTGASGKVAYFTGAGAMTVADSTSYGRGLWNLADQAALQTAVGIGTAGLESSDTFLLAENDLSDVADAASARTNIGLGSIATQAADNVTITGGVVSGLSSVNGVQMASPTTGTVVLGLEAAPNLTTSNYSIYIGYQAGYFQTAGIANIYIGESAGRRGTTCKDCVLIGSDAGYSETIDDGLNGGEHCVALGNNALRSGDASTIWPQSSQTQLAFDGDRCTCIGMDAWVTGTAPAYQTAIGSRSQALVDNEVALGRNDGSDRVRVPGSLVLMEGYANGTHCVGFTAPASVAADVTWTLPGADGSANGVLVTNGSGVLSFTNSPTFVNLTMTGNATIGNASSDAHTLNGIVSQPHRPYCFLERATNLSLSDNANTQMTGWTQIEDNDNMWTSGNSMTLTRAGLWAITFSARFDSQSSPGATDFIQAYVSWTGDSRDYGQDLRHPPDGLPGRLGSNAVFIKTVNTTSSISLYVRQSSGGSLNLAYASLQAVFLG